MKAPLREKRGFSVTLLFAISINRFYIFYIAFVLGLRWMR